MSIGNKIFRLVRWLVHQMVIVFLAIITLCVVCVVGSPIVEYILEPFIKAGGGIIAIVLFAVWSLKMMDREG